MRSGQWGHKEPALVDVVHTGVPGASGRLLRCVPPFCGPLAGPVDLYRWPRWPPRWASERKWRPNRSRTLARGLPLSLLLLKSVGLEAGRAAQATFGRPLGRGLFSNEWALASLDRAAWVACVAWKGRAARRLSTPAAVVRRLPTNATPSHSLVRLSGGFHLVLTGTVDDEAAHGERYYAVRSVRCGPQRIEGR